MSGDCQRVGDALDSAGLGRSGSSTWLLFCDWCAATDHPPLPADPPTLAQFLDAHPAASSTQRRRVADIDSVHRRSGLAEPGHTVTIRLALGERRSERTTRVRAAAASIIETIPAHGWPQGLFGRRDAMILTLVASGMSPTEITGLRRGDITIDNSDLVVCGDHRIPSELFGDRPGHGPVAIYRRWAQIQTLLDNAATTRMVAAALDPTRSPGADASVDAVPAAHTSEPLLVRIDRWGHTPWTPDSLTRRSAVVLTRAHLAGRPPIHRLRTADHDATASRAIPLEQDDLVLDGSYYAHGNAARRRAHEQLSDMGARLDEVDDRIDDLLHRLADIADVLDPERVENTAVEDARCGTAGGYFGGGGRLC